MVRNLSAPRWGYSKLSRRPIQSCFAVLLLLQFSSSGIAQERRKVRLAYSALSISFLNVFIARDAGLFKKHGIDPELIQMAGPLPVAALTAGEIDFLTGYTTGIVATGRGAPLKGIMVSLRKPPFYLIAGPTLQKPIDIVGKRIGVDRIGSLQHLVARLLLKTKGIDSEKVLFTQTGSVSNTVTSLGQSAVSAAVLSAPHNVIMTQKGFRQIGAADDLPVQFPTSGLVVSDAKLRTDINVIKNVIRVMLEANAFSLREKNWVTQYVRDKWQIEQKAAETVYEQWRAILTPEGRLAVKDMQESFDIAYAQKQIAAPVNVAAVTDFSLLEQVLAGK